MKMQSTTSVTMYREPYCCRSPPQPSTFASWTTRSLVYAPASNISYPLPPPPRCSPVQQFHDGLGFLTSHGLLSNTFEYSLQQVNPKLTLPYWDFTIESSSTGVAAYKDLDDVFGSSIKTPLFQESWFGSTDPATDMVRFLVFGICVCRVT